MSGYDGDRVEEPVLRGAPFLGKPCGRANLRATLARLAAAAPSAASGGVGALPLALAVGRGWTASFHKVIGRQASRDTI